ncbi:MAG: AAA family ATPase [Pseudomonadota bacterium]
MYQRNIESEVREALSDTRPVVLINGARQTGKSTLALKFAADLSVRYITLDDATVLSSATSDPTGFVRNLDSFVVIDEVQKAPRLFPAIKAHVDKNRRPGNFLLTGSANVMMLPRLAESLAGRMEIITLWPLSQGELMSRQERFIEGSFASRLPALTDAVESDTNLLQTLITGGYSEVVRRNTESRRR